MANNKEFVIDFEKAVETAFFQRKTEVVAKELLGKVLIRRHQGIWLAGKIVETEAYLPIGDLSCHAAIGKTKRNAPMFDDGGILYVYKIYGVHHCINFVSETEGIGCAVLIRAVEPLLGIDKMMRLRNTDKIHNLCKGPGNLAKAFGFTKVDNFSSLHLPELFIQGFDSKEKIEIARTKRIGIKKSANMLLRFIQKESEFVSAVKI
ncbi:DNA-3-methyladenine glycosylase [Bacteroidota bacterium]